MEPRPRLFLHEAAEIFRRQVEGVQTYLARRQLGQLDRPDTNPHAFARVSGVRIVEQAQDRPRGEACADYVFGEPTPNRLVVQRRLESGYDQTSDPQPGDVVVYYKNGVLTHIGRVVDHGEIESKWGGKGDVLRHKPLLVPPAYGNELRYYKEKKG